MRKLLIALLIVAVAGTALAQDFTFYNFKKKATAGGGGPTTYTSDTFTDTNGTLLSAHTSDSAHTWTKSGGGSNIDIQTNKIRAATANQFGLYYISATSTSADYSVQGTITETSYGNITPGIAGRISTSATTGYYVSWGETYGRWDLYSVTDEYGVTSLGSWAVASGNPGDPATAAVVVKLEMIGSAIKVYFDGTQRISVTNTAWTAAGRAGVGIHYSDNTGRIDDWSAINP